MIACIGHKNDITTAHHCGNKYMPLLSGGMFQSAVTYLDNACTPALKMPESVTLPILADEGLIPVMMMVISLSLPIIPHITSLQSHSQSFSHNYTVPHECITLVCRCQRSLMCGLVSKLSIVCKYMIVSHPKLLRSCEYFMRKECDAISESCVI